MIEALVMAAVMGGGPDHHTLHTQEINIRKPHKGAFSDVITEAAEIPKKWKPFASCVLDRESGGTLDKVQSGSGARNPNSSASGRWQFLQSSWGQSLPYMVAKELKDNGLPKGQAVEVRMELQDRPIHKWHGYWQDIAFVAVVTEPRGWIHWSGGSGCNSKRP